MPSIIHEACFSRTLTHEAVKTLGDLSRYPIQQRSRLRKFFSRSHDAVIRVYDDASNVIETHEQLGEFKEW